MKALIALSSIALLAWGCSTAPRSSSTTATCRYVESGYGPKGKVPVRAEPVVTGLVVPWGIAFLPDGSLLVTERPGRLQLIDRNGNRRAVTAEIPVDGRSESGLLGIAVHPRFTENRYFYLYYTTPVGPPPHRPDGEKQNRVQRYRLSDDSRSATAEKILVDGIPASIFHDGGRLRFGPDGMLYVGTGDARAPELSPSRQSLAGKILRYTPDGEIPTDNPIAGSPVYVSGIRNTQGFDWLADGRLVVTDHGPSGELLRRGGDEISIASAGANLGWPDIWGCETAPGSVTPILTWKNAVPPGGAVIYRGDKIPQWKGSLIVGALRAQHLHRIAFDGAGRVTLHETYFDGEPPKGLGRIRDVAVSPAGELFVTTSNCDGRGDCPATKDGVYRIVPGGTR